MTAAGDRAHGHAHDDARDRATLRLGVATALNVGFAVVQVVVGLLIGSVVVLADAAHQAVDALGLLTALAALTVARRPPTHDWTFGFGKADALGGFVSALLLLGSVAWIVVESVRRLFEPEAVSGAGVIAIGLLAVVVNGLGVLLVGHGHGEEAMSLRAARLHLVTDLAGSVIVVAAGVVLVAGGPEWIDPVASLVLSAAVLWSTWRIAMGSVAVLLDRVPERLSSREVSAMLAAQPGVDDVHHVHLRPLGGGTVSVTAHVVVDGARSVHDAQQTLEELSSVLLTEHDIAHATLQLECHDCGDDDVGDRDHDHGHPAS
jgi:cobalt-zinc-cadmium efflux system protein